MKKTLKEFIESLPDDEQEEISKEAAKLLAEYKAGKIEALPWEEVKRRLAELEADNNRLRRTLRWLALRTLDDVAIGAPITHITHAEHVGEHQLWLSFSNNTEGVIDLAQHFKFVGQLAPLADETFFHQVFVDRGTICWPGDISMDSTVMYHLTMGIPIDIASDDSASDEHEAPDA